MDYQPTLKDTDYRENFKRATQFSLTHNLVSWNFNGFAEPLYDERERTAIVNFILEEIYEKRRYEVQQLAFNCTAISYVIKKLLDEQNIESFITSGNTIDKGEYVHFESSENLLQMLKEGKPQPAIKFHTWITLSTGQVIDLAWPAALALIVGLEKAPLNGKGLFWVEPDDDPHLPGNKTYQPIFIGSSYFDRVKIIPQVQFHQL